MQKCCYLENVGQEKVVSRAVDLVRRNGDRHELVRACLGHRYFPHGLMAQEQ